MATPTSEKIYTFTCAGATSRVLNLYYPNSITDGQNVCLWTADGSLEQQWKFSGGKLLNMRDTGYALDKYTVAGNANNNNADVWTANDDTNQKLTFEPVSGNTVRIKLSSSNLYLTAVSNANGTSNGKSPTSPGNVYWAAKKSSTMQQWTFKEISTPSGTQITVTGMPSGIYDNDTEYFHPQSGMKNGTWSANGGATIEKKVANYYKTVYGVAPTSKLTYLYNLFGAKLTDRSDFHIGLDIYRGMGSKVTSAHSGVVIKCGQTSSNEVAIYDGFRTFYYLHMSNLQVKEGDSVTAGKTVLGYESDRGWATGSHLHLEVFPDKEMNGPKTPPDVSGSIPSISPYDYI